jgi:ferritin-like metal-binding protein YciE
VVEYLPVFCHVGFLRSCQLCTNLLSNLLQETLDEEGAADKALTTLAETVINFEAVAPTTGP